MRKEQGRWKSLLCLGVAVLCVGILGAAAWQNMHPSANGDARPGTPVAPAGPLSGLVIAVDAGHGGYDGGAVGRTTRVEEKGLNLDVALRLRDALHASGAQVLLTRSGDYALCDEDPPIRKKLQDMQRRAALVKAGAADLLLSIHMNEYSSGRESGPQVFFRKGCEAGRQLAAIVQEQMNASLIPARKRTSQSGDYYILTQGIPSVLVECGFLSNAKEEALLSDEGYRQRVAQSIHDGLVAWAALDVHPPALPAQNR